MATLQRALVNLEMLSEDINMLSSSELGRAPHLRLLQTILSCLNELSSLTQQETEASFQKSLHGSVFEGVFKRKSMVEVYAKLLRLVITAWEASDKANLIIADNFDERADKRLELLQVKAIKAKSQLKTVASAMGEVDYARFIEALGLHDHQWQWEILRARF